MKQVAKLNPSKFGIDDMSNYCTRNNFDSVAMWPLLQVLDTSCLALQQCDRLVLAILREIEPLHIRKKEQKLDTFLDKWPTIFLSLSPLTHTA